MKFRTKTIVAGASVLALAGGSVAYAAIPDTPDDEFHACVSNTNGATTIIDHEAGATCPSGTSHKVWQQSPLVQFVRVQKELPCNAENTGAEGFVDAPSGKRIISVHGTNGGPEDTGPFVLPSRTIIVGQEGAVDEASDQWAVGSTLPDITVGTQGRVDGVHVIVSKPTNEFNCTTTLTATVDFVVYDV